MAFCLGKRMNLCLRTVCKELSETEIEGSEQVHTIEYAFRKCP